jgi:hypothetical protein
MTKFFGFLIFTLGMTAAPVCINTTPNMVNDSLPVCATIPGLGERLILPASNFTATVFWEDLDGRHNGICISGLPGDCDYNDAKLTIFGNYALNLITLDFDSGLTSYLNTISWVGGSISVNRNAPGPVGAVINWIPGSELFLQDVTSVGTHWLSGPGSANMDHKPHAILNMQVQQGGIPEPGTLILVGVGALMLLYMLIYRRTNKP